MSALRLTDCLLIRQSDEHVPGEPFGFDSPEWSDLGRTVIHCLSPHLLLLHSQWAAACCLYATLNKWFTINHYCSVVGSQFVIFLLYTEKERAVHSSHIYQSNNTQDIQLIIYLCKQLYSYTCVKDICARITLYSLHVGSNEWTMCLFVLHNSQLADQHDRSDHWFDRHLIS